ncbi:hypothetical protein MRB53_037370 [Persea americana]|nr:hypothetical protein MRB53_037370 [Persea americana]
MPLSSSTCSHTVAMARGRYNKKTGANDAQESSSNSKPAQEEPPRKRQKREEYRNTHDASELPKKKFYRQRAHANPFSDHALT